MQRLQAQLRCFKVLVLGSSQSGKSAMIHQFVTHRFMSEYKETLGSDMVITEETPEDPDEEGEKVALHIWSCSGHQRYLPLVQQLYSGTLGVVLVFDKTDASSFKAVNFWYNEVKRAIPDATIFLVGNKCEAVDEIKVSESDGAAQASVWNVPYLEVSAKTGEHLSQLVSDLLAKMLLRSH